MSDGGETDGEGAPKRFREEETPDLIDQFIAATYDPPIRIAGIVECAQIGPSQDSAEFGSAGSRLSRAGRRTYARS